MDEQLVLSLFFQAIYALQTGKIGFEDLGSFKREDLVRFEATSVCHSLPQAKLSQLLQ